MTIIADSRDRISLYQNVIIKPNEEEPPIDICGAGDTFLSALACALSCGAALHEAAFFANTASAVTIRKLNMTGTASRSEIEKQWKN